MPLHYPARKLKMTPPGFAKLEKAEGSGAISLKTLERAADALNCDLVYALLPRDGTLFDQIKSRARKKARKVIEPVGHSMLLEAQSTDDSNEQIEQLANEIVASPHPKLWSEE
jgi:predicted DNA-binding mobile mystery protein A